MINAWIVENFFTGTWQLVWHWGVGIGLIVCCLAGMWLSPIWKKDFLYAAIVVATALLFEAVGAHDYKAHIVAQQLDLQKHVNDVIKSTQTPRARHAHDPFDRPNY